MGLEKLKCPQIFPGPDYVLFQLRFSTPNILGGISVLWSGWLHLNDLYRLQAEHRPLPSLEDAPYGHSSCTASLMLSNTWLSRQEAEPAIPNAV